MRIAALVAAFLLSGCATVPVQKVAPLSVIGVQSCQGFLGSLVVMTDGTIVVLETTLDQANAIREKVGHNHAVMIPPTEDCPPEHNN